MDASASKNSNPSPNFSTPPTVPQHTTHFLAPSVSLNNMPLSEESTNFFNLKLDVGGCLRELRNRDLEITRGERVGMGNNKRIGWEMNLPTNSMFASASNPSPSTLSTPRKTEDCDGQKLKFVLEKKLTRSDVSTVGRIILPKKQAEAELPILKDKWGINLTVRDALSSDKWTMKYRYWPNKCSKIYVLENTGDFIQKNNLKSGDWIAIYQDNRKTNFVCARKTERSPFSLELVVVYDEDEGADNNQSSVRSDDYPTSSTGNIIVASGHSRADMAPVDDNAIEPTVKPWDSWSHGFGYLRNDGFGVDDNLFDFYNHNHTQFGRLPRFDDQDLSLFDFNRSEDDTDWSRDNKQQ